MTIGKVTVLAFSALTVILLVVPVVRVSNLVIEESPNNELPPVFYYVIPLIIMAISFGPIFGVLASIEKPFKSKNLRGLLTLAAYLIFFIVVIVFTSGIFAVADFGFKSLNSDIDRLNLFI